MDNRPRFINANKNQDLVECGYCGKAQLMSKQDTEFHCKKCGKRNSFNSSQQAMLPHKN